MRFVERLHIRPTHCLAIPFLGANHPKGYVDFGVELVGMDNHVAISVEAMQQAARDVPECALVSRDELTLVQTENDVLRREAEDLREQLKAADEELNAIHTIRARGYSVQKKPGRKPAVTK